MQFIVFGVKNIVIIPDYADSRFVFSSGNFADSRHFFIDIADFLKPSVIPAGIIQNSVPVNLRSKGACPPSEIADKIRSVGYGLHGPQCHLSPFRRRLHHAGIPAPGTRLLLHNAENP